MFTLVLLTCAIVLSSRYAFADISVDLDPASRDILFNDRFAGNIQSIKLIVNFIDTWMIRAVSIIGFAIISVTMLRNALNGLCVAYPNFWLKVHAIKTGQHQGNVTTGQKIMATIFPDILPWTDFNNKEMLSPRDYFIRALPLAIINVFIGSFIFSAYYRETIGNFSVLGLHVWDKIILSRDYISDFDNLMDAGTDYDFTFDKTTKGQRQADLAKEIYNKIRAAYGNINDTDAKAVLGSSVESLVMGWTDMDNYMSSEEYKFSYSVVNTNSAKVESKNGKHETNGPTKIFNYDFPMGQVISSEANANEAAKYIMRVQVKFAPAIFSPATTATSKNATMTINAPLNVKSGGDALEITLPSVEDQQFTIGSSGGGSIFKDGSGKKYRVSATGNTLKVSSADRGGTVTISDGMNLIYASGTKLQYNQHPIASFSLNQGDSPADITVNIDGHSYKYGEKIDYNELSDDKKAGSSGDGEEEQQDEE